MSTSSNGLPTWQSVPIETEVSGSSQEAAEDTQIELHTDVESVGLKIRPIPASQKNQAQWQGIDISPPADSARSGIVTIFLVILLALTIAYVALGWSHISNVDDVIKLLSPVLQVTTTAVGAAVAYYFSTQDRG